MPLFTYKCQDCEESFEELVSISQSAEQIDCPKCRGNNTRKQLSIVARPIQASASSGAFHAPAASCSPGGI